MISKKVISQTIPTVYTNNNEFISSEFNPKVASLSTSQPQKTTRISANYNHVSTGSINNSNSTSKKLSNGISVSPTKTENNLKPVSYFDFHYKRNQAGSKENLNSSQKLLDSTKTSVNNINGSNNDLNKSSKSIDRDSPPIIQIPFQQNFQKFVIERHMNHFNHRQNPSDPNKATNSSKTNGSNEDSQNQTINKSVSSTTSKIISNNTNGDKTSTNNNYYSNTNYLNSSNYYYVQNPNYNFNEIKAAFEDKAKKVCRISSLFKRLAYASAHTYL